MYDERLFEEVTVEEVYDGDPYIVLDWSWCERSDEEYELMRDSCYYHTQRIDDDSEIPF